MPTLTTAAHEPAVGAPAAMHAETQQTTQPGSEQRAPRDATAIVPVDPVDLPRSIARKPLPLAVWGGVAGMAMGLGAGFAATLTGGLIGIAAVASLRATAKSRELP